VIMTKKITVIAIVDGQVNVVKTVNVVKELDVVNMELAIVFL